MIYYTIFCQKAQPPKPYFHKLCVDIFFSARILKKAHTALFQIALEKRILVIFDPVFVNGGDVKTAIRLLPQTVTVTPRDFTVTLALLFGYRLGRQSERVAFARFHFDKAIRSLFIGDNIRFAERRCVIALQDFITAFFQILAS